MHKRITTGPHSQLFVDQRVYGCARLCPESGGCPGAASWNGGRLPTLTVVAELTCRADGKSRHDALARAERPTASISIQTPAHPREGDVPLFPLRGKWPGGPKGVYGAR